MKITYLRRNNKTVALARPRGIEPPSAVGGGQAGSLETLTLEELEVQAKSLQRHLDYSVSFVSEQEVELRELRQNIANLERQLKHSSNGNWQSLTAQLGNERERKEMLEATLVGQWEKIKEEEVHLNQCQEILQRRQATRQAIKVKKVSAAPPAPEMPADNPAPPESEAKRRGWWRWWMVALPAAGLLGVGATVFYAANLLPTAAPPVPASQSAIAQDVSALGYLEPQGEVIKVSAPAFQEGTRVEQLLVKLGQQVRAGQVLAVLDSQNRLQAALEQANSQVEIARARLQQVKAGAKTGQIQAQDAGFQRTQAELSGQISSQKSAIAALEAQLAGEKQSQGATSERLKAEWLDARRDCQRYGQLYQDGGVSEQERDRACLKQETAQESLKEAQANLNQTVNTLQERISEAKANRQRTVATLEKQVAADRANRNAVAEVRPVDVQVAQRELQAAIASVQRARADLALAYVRAPQSGQILKIHSRPGELVGEKGIVELGKTDRMYVTAEVYETDISRVKIGQRATIDSDGITRSLQGTVEEIGLQIKTKDVLGTDPVADADARVVEVKIRLEPAESKQIAGLTNLQVNVVIHTTPQ
jgi:ABC exporter DevB family membrane fusion protein